jgi:hypothetical protein
MAVADPLDGIRRQETGGVDGTPVEIGPFEAVRCLRAHLQEILDGSEVSGLASSKLKV